MSSSIQIQAKRMNSNNSVVGICMKGFKSHETRNPFHMAMLLDVSGSMEGERIDSLKRTLHLLVDHMTDTDKLTMISYNATAKIEQAACSDKTLLRQAIDSLKANGGTNMESAILELAQLNQQRTEFPKLNAVFLMTDGEINQGIQTETGLLHLLKTAVPRDVAVSTLGYGHQHNSNLLQALAVRSRGTYTYAEANEMLPTIIGNIACSMEDETVREVRVRVPDGAKCLEYGTVEEGAYYVGSLISEKEQWVVLEAAENQTDVTVTWKPYDSEEEQTQVVEITNVEEYQEDVGEQWIRARAVDCMNRAKQQIATVEELQAFDTEIEVSSVRTRPMVIRIQAQIKELIEYMKNQPPSHFCRLLPPLPAGFIGRQHAVVYEPHANVLTRLTSNMTTFAMQRGVLSAVPASASSQTGCDMDPIDTFCSPHQRQVSQAMTATFSQNPQ